MAAVAMFSPYGPARALARQVTATPTGNVYLLDARGGAMIDQTDVAHFQTRGYSLAPVPVVGQVPVFAPYQPDQEMSRRVRHQPTGNHYIFNASGFAMVDTADAAWFLTQGYSLASVPTAGQVVMYAAVEVSQALAGWIVNPNTGNSYVINGAGYVVVNPVDVAWFRSQGFAPALTAVEVFPPVTDGQQATVAADFVGGQYWAGAATQATFAAWLTAVGATFTRASSATYLDRGIIATAGTNGARFPTDLTGVAQGIRLTGAVTNNLLQSNAFSTAPWGAAGAITLTPLAVTGPDGAPSGWLLSSVAGSTGNVTQIQGVLTAAAQTLSFFVKQGTSPTFYVQANNQTAVSVLIVVLGTWTNGVPVLSLNSGAGTFQATQLANGWFRIDVTFTPGAGAVGNSFRVIFYPETTGNGSGLGTYVFGFQMTNTPFGADYVPTTSAAVTQAADNLNWPFTQTRFSALVGVSAGWPQPTPQNGMLLTVGPTASFPLFISAGSNLPVTYNGSVNLPTTALSATGLPFKAMSAGSPAGRSIVRDGLTPVASEGTTYVSGTPATIYAGNNIAANSYFNGNLSRLSLWHGWYASGAEMIRLTGGAAPTWLQALNGVYPSFYADFTVGNLWYGGSVVGFNNWLAALGGTYARASSATYIDVNGVVQTVGSGVARVTSQGLRYTPAITNLCLQSSAFGTAPWSFSGGTITAGQPSPDGGTAASLLSDPTAQGVRQTLTVTAATTYSASIFIKKTASDPGYSGGLSLSYSGGTATNPVATLNSFTGALALGGGATGSVVDCGTYWRLQMVAPSGTGNTALSFRVYPNVTAAGAAAAGTMTAWGAQFEASDTVNDYVPTTAATATQAADSLFWPSGFVSSVGGSFVGSGEAGAGAAAFQSILTFNNAGTYGASNGFTSRVLQPITYGAGGSATVAQVSVSPPLSPYKICASYNIPTTQQQVVARDGTNNVNATLDFTAVGTTRLQVGALNSGLAQPYNGWFRSLAYYPTFPTPAQATALLASLP